MGMLSKRFGYLDGELVGEPSSYTIFFGRPGLRTFKGEHFVAVGTTLSRVVIGMRGLVEVFVVTF